jgi:hypothetical protein
MNPKRKLQKKQYEQDVLLLLARSPYMFAVAKTCYT